MTAPVLIYLHVPTCVCIVTRKFVFVTCVRGRLYEIQTRDDDVILLCGNIHHEQKIKLTGDRPRVHINKFQSV